MTPNAKRKLTLVGTALALCLSTTSTALAACSDAAHWNVEWNGCDKSNADLHRASLASANLRGANLRGAVLTGAKLSNADLRGATWRDGWVCGKGSIGGCK
jgi:uncharacterized protein YjbI with pentapeptide repeats